MKTTRKRGRFSHYSVDWGKSLKGRIEPRDPKESDYG